MSLKTVRVLLIILNDNALVTLIISNPIFSKFIHLHKKHGSSKQPPRSTFDTFVHILQSCSSPSCQIANDNTAWVGTKESGTINLYNNNTAFRSLSIVIQISQNTPLVPLSEVARRSQVSMIYQSKSDFGHGKYIYQD
jgi:hypothetical protein